MGSTDLQGRQLWAPRGARYLPALPSLFLSIFHRFATHYVSVAQGEQASHKNVLKLPHFPT